MPRSPPRFWSIIGAETDGRISAGYQHENRIGDRRQMRVWPTLPRRSSRRGLLAKIATTIGHGAALSLSATGSPAVKLGATVLSDWTSCSAAGPPQSPI